MALDSTSTAAQAIAQYNDNLRWWDSQAKAQNLLEAVLWLLANRAQVMADRGATLNYSSLEKLREQLERKTGVGLTGEANKRSSFVRAKLR